MVTLPNGDGFTRLARLVANVGFPILVAAYVLWRLDTRLDTLNQEINRLALSIARVCGGP